MGLVLSLKPYPLSVALFGLMSVALIGVSVLLKKLSVKQSILVATKFIGPCCAVLGGIGFCMVLFLNYAALDVVNAIFPFELIRNNMAHYQSYHAQIFATSLSDLLRRVSLPVLVSIGLFLFWRTLRFEARIYMVFLIIINLSYLVRINYVYMGLAHFLLILIVLTCLIPGALKSLIPAPETRIFKNHKFSQFLFPWFFNAKRVSVIVGLILLTYFLRTTALRDPVKTYGQIRANVLTRATVGPVEGLYLEKWLVGNLEKFSSELKERYGPKTKIAFIGNRYHQMIPQIYDLINTFDGQILYLHGSINSYDEVLENLYSNKDSLFSRLRAEAVERIEQTKTSVVVFPLFDRALAQPPSETGDPLHDYLDANFVMWKVIKGETGKSLSNRSHDLVVFERKSSGV
ncbi:hypothetical protein MYX75_00075 [Acidobacteria bacterium AH-259-A15]|nr:hypothetical protein [Acidobacteria bacterium AH-259-A15]